MHIHVYDTGAMFFWFKKKKKNAHEELYLQITAMNDKNRVSIYKFTVYMY